MAEGHVAAAVRDAAQSWGLSITHNLAGQLADAALEADNAVRQIDALSRAALTSAPARQCTTCRGYGKTSSPLRCCPACRGTGREVDPPARKERRA